MRRLFPALLLAASCTVQIAGNDRTATLAGTVTGDGMPLANITVRHGPSDAGTVTTANGSYTLNLRDVPDRIVLDVAAKGFMPTKSLIEYRSGVFHYTANINVATPSNAVPGGETTLSLGGRMFKVKVPAGAVVDGGRIEVAVMPPEGGPGAMETTESNELRLQSQGMFFLRAVNDKGDPVQLLAPGGQSVTFSVADDLARLTDTQEMKTYSLQEDAQWAPQTTTTATGANLVAQNQGYWNADRAYRTSCVRGKLSAPTKSCAGEKVKAGGLDGIYTQDTSGAEGQFCVEGPQGRSQSLSAGSVNSTVAFPSTPGSCRANPTACTEIPALQVTDADCPASCDKAKLDAPDGCKSKPTGGSSDPYFGYTCSQSVTCCPSNNQGCGRTYKSCADSAGNGGYITSDGKKYWCTPTSSSCIQTQANLVVQYCLN